MTSPRDKRFSHPRFYGPTVSQPVVSSSFPQVAASLCALCLVFTTPSFRREGLRRPAGSLLLHLGDSAERSFCSPTRPCSRGNSPDPFSMSAPHAHLLVSKTTLHVWIGSTRRIVLRRLARVDTSLQEALIAEKNFASQAEKVSIAPFAPDMREILENRAHCVRSLQQKRTNFRLHPLFAVPVLLLSPACGRSYRQGAARISTEEGTISYPWAQSDQVAIDARSFLRFPTRFPAVHSHKRLDPVSRTVA